MSNVRGNRPSQPPSSLPHEPSLEALALAEWLAELRAAGDVPELSALIATLPPDSAGDLADAMTMLDALVAAAEADDLQAGEPSTEGTSEDIAPLTLSLGAQRAIADIFGAGDADAPLAMVAETPAPYAYGVTIKAGADEAVGLLALAHRQGLDTEELASRIMLSPTVLRWLDHVALPRELQPDALVFHLVGALGVPRQRVQEALVRENASTSIDIKVDIDIHAVAFDLADVLTTSASLTPTQRAYWAAHLAEQQ